MEWQNVSIYIYISMTIPTDQFLYLLYFMLKLYSFEASYFYPFLSLTYTRLYFCILILYTLIISCLPFLLSYTHRSIFIFSLLYAKVLFFQSFIFLSFSILNVYTFIFLYHYSIHVNYLLSSICSILSPQINFYIFFTLC